MPVITESAFPQPQIFCMQHPVLQQSTAVCRNYGKNMAEQMHSVIHPLSTHTLTCLSRASHVFVDVDVAKVQLLTFLLRAGNAWVTTAVGFLQQKAKMWKESIDKIHFHPISSIYAIKDDSFFY